MPFLKNKNKFLHDDLGSIHVHDPTWLFISIFVYMYTQTHTYIHTYILLHTYMFVVVNSDALAQASDF